VIGVERPHIEAVATPLPDPTRETNPAAGAAPMATTLARAERHSITETLTVTGSLVAAFTIMDDFDRIVSSRLSRLIGPKDETELAGDKLA
jgi:hypothetical protein